MSCIPQDLFEFCARLGNVGELEILSKRGGCAVVREGRSREVHVVWDLRGREEGELNDGARDVECICYRELFVARSDTLNGRCGIRDYVGRDCLGE